MHTFVLAIFSALMAELLLLSVPIVAWSAPGDLDFSFGNGGTLIADFEDAYSEAHAVVGQSDGMIVAAGGASPNPDGSSSSVAIVRYDSGGNLDTSFGAEGRVVTDLGSNDLAMALHLQPDGALLMSGRSGQYFALARYGPTGDLDPSFGTAGVVVSTIDAALEDSVLQSDGKLVAGGEAPSGQFVLARYRSNGSLDPLFGVGGVVTTLFAGGEAKLRALTVQTDGKIVAVGAVRRGGKDDFALARYNSDGTLDTTFGEDGRVETQIGNDDETAYRVAVLGDGRIVVAGSSSVNGSWAFAIARYNSDGSLDGSFGTDGTVTTDFTGGTDWAISLNVQDDGRLIAAGRKFNGTDHDFALVRYEANGQLDDGFGSGGLASVSFGPFDDFAFASVLDAAGAVVLVGKSDGRFALARFEGERACGNGNVDGSEACDDGNTDDGDCCSSSCTFEAAGSPCLDDDLCNGDETCDGAGTCDAGTPLDCDDSNICTADTCLAATGCESTPEPVATSCADSDLCNGDETCDGAGSCDSGAPLDCGDGDLCTQDSCDPNLGCQNAAEPATMCLDEWGKGSLLIKETVAGKEKLIAKLVKGPAILFSDFGDPTDALGTDYQACLYDDAGSYVGALDLDQAGLACGTKACWRGLGPRGFIYKDSAAAASGIKQLRLMAGADGKSMIKLIAGNKASKGQDQLPTGLSEGLVNASGATLQLFGTDAPECFSIDFTRVRKQESHVFSALK